MVLHREHVCLKGNPMKIFSRTLLLYLLFVSASVLSSVEAHADGCREAAQVVSLLPDLSGEDLVKQEDRILHLCPEGAPGHAVTRLRRKRASDLVKLADLQMVNGHDRQAKDVFRQLLRIDETNSSIRYTLGVLYEQQGVLDKAEREYRHVIVHQETKNGDARRHLADIYTMQGDFPRAIGEYRELLTEYKDNPLLHFKLAQVCERDQKYNEAIAEYMEAIRLAPNTIEVHKELAALYLKRGQGKEAANQYRAVLRLDRSDDSTRNALITVYVNLKNYTELFALIKEDVELSPYDPNSHFRLGLMYDFRKEYDASIAEYQKALALKSDHAKSLKGLGKVYLKLGNPGKAREYLEAATKADPKLIEASEILYNLHIEQVRAKEAIKRKKLAHKKSIRKNHHKHHKKKQSLRNNKKKSSSKLVHKKRKTSKKHATTKKKRRKQGSR